MADISEIITRLKTSGLILREHQIEGIRVILKWLDDGHGGILADEMGLGKTCQAIIALAQLAKRHPSDKFVIICPLSVIEHWENEINRFGCDYLKLFLYKGYKDVREELRDRFHENDWNVCLTTYNYFRIDSGYFKFKIKAFIVDEAHSVKSQNSQLHQFVSSKRAKYHLLLTGTPIQNDIEEFYTLLSLADPTNFDPSEDARQEFFALPKIDLDLKVREATEKYVLRRLKSEVCKEIPSSQEVMLLHGMTEFQKKLYNAVLAANHGFFEQFNTQKQSLMNILIQLRKAVSHPYLFQGVEPEPYTEGEHLFTASGKFMVLDKLLKFLKAQHHRCLIFSMYARSLEILADALNLRGYKFEHFDGSSNAENRFKSIDNFQKPGSDVFCFLISTKAGGVGLTLTAADTCIFLESDFNPQNDLQAAARCHRIGQDKPVKVIRLLAEHTIDNFIRKRAGDKLKLSEYVLDDANGSLSSNTLREVLLSDLAELNKTDNSTEAYDKLLTDEYFVSQIGKTDENGHWMNEITDTCEIKVVKDTNVEFFPRSNPLATFSKADEHMFDEIKTSLNDVDIIVTKAVKTASTRPKKSAAELQKQRQLRQAEIKAEKEAKERRRIEAKKKKWEDNNYVTSSITTLMKTSSKKLDAKPIGKLYRVFGSVIKPLRANADASYEAWLVHSVDTGGEWSQGGLFSAFDELSSSIAKQYEKAAAMKDILCGDVHFIESVNIYESKRSSNISPDLDLDVKKTRNSAPESLEQTVSVVLMIAQTTRDRSRRTINEYNIQKCFETIANFALTRDSFPSIHMPMFWWGLSSLTERDVCNMIDEELCKKGLDVYVYHYRRPNSGNGPIQPLQLMLNSPAQKSKRKSQLSGPPAKRQRVMIDLSDDEEQVFNAITLSESENEIEFIEEDETSEEGTVDIVSDDEEEEDTNGTICISEDDDW